MVDLPTTEIIEPRKGGSVTTHIITKQKRLASASLLCGEWDLNPHDLKRSQDP